MNESSTTNVTSAPSDEPALCEITLHGEGPSPRKLRVRPTEKRNGIELLVTTGNSKSGLTMSICLSMEDACNLRQMVFYTMKVIEEEFWYWAWEGLAAKAAAEKKDKPAEEPVDTPVIAGVADFPF